MARIRLTWVLAVLSAMEAVACALLGLAVLLVGDAGRTQELVNWILRLSGVMAIWFGVGPAWATIFPGRARNEDRYGRTG